MQILVCIILLMVPLSVFAQKPPPQPAPPDEETVTTMPAETETPVPMIPFRLEHDSHVPLPTAIVIDPAAVVCSIDKDRVLTCTGVTPRK